MAQIDRPGSPVHVDTRPLRLPGGDEVDTSEFALPHAITFAQLLGLPSRTYSWRWDEAYADSWDDAIAMRRDCFLMALTQERYFAAAQLDWHIEPEDPRDAEQKDAAAQIEAIMRRTPDMQQMLMALMEAVWYGRYGVQMAFDKQRVLGNEAKCICKWAPVNGDKLQYRYQLPGDTSVRDGEPVLLVHPSEWDRLKGATSVITDRGRGLLLTPGYWRDRFVIHRHQPDDPDFLNGIMAGARFGLGIRSRLYWFDWIRKEYLSWVTDFIERAGMGFMIWYYETGNPTSELEVRTAAAEQSKNTVVVMPRPIGKEHQGAGVERVEVPMSGADLLLKLVKHLEDLEERYVVGQKGSASAEGGGIFNNSTFVQDTKYRITKYDAIGLQESMTRDCVRVIHKMNRPQDEFRLFFKFAIDRPNPQAMATSAVQLHGLGLDLDKDQLYSMTGFKKPGDGADILQGLAPEGAPVGGAEEEQGPVIDDGDDRAAEAEGFSNQPWAPFNGPKGGKWEKNVDTGDVRHREDYAAEDWAEERGPRAGRRWKNLNTGEVRYRSPGGVRKKPGFEPKVGKAGQAHAAFGQEVAGAFGDKDQEALHRVGERLRASTGRREGLAHGALMAAARQVKLPGRAAMKKHELVAHLLHHLGMSPPVARASAPTAEPHPLDKHLDVLKNHAPDSPEFAAGLEALKAAKVEPDAQEAIFSEHEKWSIQRDKALVDMEKHDPGTPKFREAAAALVEARAALNSMPKPEDDRPGIAEREAAKPPKAKRVPGKAAQDYKERKAKIVDKAKAEKREKQKAKLLEAKNPISRKRGAEMAAQMHEVDPKQAKKKYKAWKKLLAEGAEGYDRERLEGAVEHFESLYGKKKDAAAEFLKGKE